MNNRGERISLNEENWELLFNRYHILNRVDEDGEFRISATQIRAYREPRLMTKFDHTINLPDIFAQNGLSILPVTRGDYIIARFNSYHRFELCDATIKQATLPPYIQSLTPSNIPSETIALNCAAASGILQDFMEDDDIIPTVSGRMGSGDFSFYIDDLVNGMQHEMSVSSSQIEIDAVYEGRNSMAIFEAKRDLADDFLVRQLYYPFRVWRARVRKPVRPIFFVYSNGIYQLFEYSFEDINHYDSIRLIRQQNYSVEDVRISRNDIEEVLATTEVLAEPRVPFPQADSFERVINLSELASQGPITAEEITENYAFDARQTTYYADACLYLGLIHRTMGNGITVYRITQEGQRILALPYQQRQLAFCQRIFSHAAFAETARIFLEETRTPTTAEIVAIMRRSNLYNVRSDETFRRRASTVRSWVQWVMNLIL